MSDKTNLIYNGDFSKGTESWSGTNIAASNGVLTVKGNLTQSIFVPVSSSRRYRLSFDLKIDNDDGSHNFYIALWPYDSKRQFITIIDVRQRTDSLTTLAADLKAGDTTVSLTSATGWTTGYVGIYATKAYGTRRCTKRMAFSSISGTTVTLSAAYTGETYPAGTQVANNYSGDSYYYPVYIKHTYLPSDWQTYTVEFDGGNSMRYDTKYFLFRTLGYQHTYSMQNVRLECISDYQECPVRDYKINPQFYRTGIVQAPFFNEVGMNIRYVRDTIEGSTANSNNHWCELQVFNDVGENIALAKDIIVGDITWSNSYITDGVVDNHYNLSNNGVSKTDYTNIVLDLGFVEHVNSIKVWHYYPDGRTYLSNKTEVSVDGENWFTVYQGKKPETIDGNEIILSPYYMSIYNSGDIWVNEIIEY